MLGRPEVVHGLRREQRLDRRAALPRGRRPPGWMSPVSSVSTAIATAARPFRVDEIGQRDDALVDGCPLDGSSRNERARYDFWFHSSGARVASSSSMSTRREGSTGGLGQAPRRSASGRRGRPSSGRCSGRHARRPSWPAGRTSSCPTRPGRSCPRNRCRARSRFPSGSSSTAAGCARTSTRRCRPGRAAGR